MNKRNQIKAIREMSGRLELNLTMWHSGDCPMYRQQVLTEETDHRKMGRRFGQSFAGKLSLRDAVDLFICQDLLNYRTGRSKKPTVENVGHFKLSLYYSWNVWDDFKKEIRTEVSTKEARQWLDDVSYSDLMNDKPRGK